MKRVFGLFAVLALFLTLTACGTKAAEPDYPTIAKAESALNAGEDLTGKTVRFKVEDLKPNSAYGYNLWTGKHMNFVSPENPGAKKGDTVTVKIEKVVSSLGSWIITYSDLTKQ